MSEIPYLSLQSFSLRVITRINLDDIKNTLEIRTK